MKNRFNLFLLALALLGASMPASATPYVTHVNGTFNLLPEMEGTNQLAGLLGTNFSMSFTASDNAAAATYTEALSDGDARGWCFCNPVFKASLQSNAVTFSQGRPVVVTVTNDYAYEGGDDLPQGVYDMIEWGGWQYDGAGGSLSSSSYYPGVNYNFHMLLVGDSGLIGSSANLPSAMLDLSHVLYGTADLIKYDNGVMVGQVVLDPPLHLVNGVLVGDGMEAGVTPVPEPASIALLLGGLGLLGARRRSSAAARG
jgi:hypothetical protein